MRLITTSALAAFIAAASVAAFAQTTGTTSATPGAQAQAPKKKACKGRAEADCTPPDCQWIAPTTTAAGKTVKGYCRKQKAAKAS